MHTYINVDEILENDFFEFKKQYSKNKFNVDGCLHYVYIIVDIRDNMKYIGKRSTKNKNLIEDFWKYCTSSKRKKDIKKYKEKYYDLQIIKTFDSIEESLLFESFLHLKFNVKNNKEFFNYQNQLPNGTDFYFNEKNTITVKNKKSNTFERININNFNNNDYEFLQKGYVAVIDEFGNKKRITCKEYNKNKIKYKRVSTNTVYAIDKNTNKKIKLICEEYHRNKDKFKTSCSEKITVLNKKTNKYEKIDIKVYHENKDKYALFSENKVFVKDIETGEKTCITSEEYKKLKNIKYVLIKESKTKFLNEDTLEFEIASFSDYKKRKELLLLFSKKAKILIKKYNLK